MVVYVEIAFLENFLIDAALLWLALFSAKGKIRVWRIVFSSTVGAFFAVLFPLFIYPKGVEYPLKFSVGFLLVYIAIFEKGIGRYAITAGLFFLFSFCLAGGVIALTDFFAMKKARVSVGAVLAVGVLLFLCILSLVRRLYKKRLLHAFVYPCRVVCGDKEIFANGFLDSGNRVNEKGKPVCFITPDLAYDLIGTASIRTERTVLTVAGIKKIKIFQADKIEIYYGETAHKIENIYLSPSTQIVGREYKILLGAGVLESMEVVN